MCCMFAVGTVLVYGQQAFPSTSFRTLDGQTVESSQLVGQGQPTVVTVWATWCAPCQMELNHFKSYYDRWTNELGAEVIAVSVDQPHHVRRISPMVRQKQWPYQIVVDSQRNLQQMLGFKNIPQLYVLDGSGKVVASYSGYKDGRAEEVDKELVKLVRSR